MPTLAETFQVADPEAAARAVHLAERYVKLRSVKDDIEANLRSVKERIEQIESELIAAMDQSNQDSIRLKKPSALISTVTSDKYALPPKADPDRRAKALKWIRRAGGKELVQPDCPAQTVSKFCRDRVQAGKPISPLLRAFTETRLSLRRD